MHQDAGEKFNELSKLLTRRRGECLYLTALANILAASF